MQKLLTAVCFFLCLTVARATVIGFDKPLIGHKVTNTTFDNGWFASLNGDTNSNANAYWYGSPPTGPFKQFEPDPGAIPGYKGGAVWLDSAALVDGAPVKPNNGMTLSKTIGDKPGDTQFLSFNLATEVTANGLAKGNPAGCFLFVDGKMIKGNGADGAFESEGPNPQFFPGSWTKYTVSFVGTGKDTITFRDDESKTAPDLNLSEETNAVIADVTAVPEVTSLGLIGLALVASRSILKKRFA